MSSYLNPNEYSQGRFNREDQFRTSYASPKNAYSRARQSYLSPGQKYPKSQKYLPQVAPSSKPYSPYPPNYQHEGDPLQISDLRLSISQLKHSLQISSDNAQRLQQQLFSERKHTYELTQIKQRLEQQIERMEFEFQRMGNYENLEGRQNSIKLQTALRENSRLSHQIGDLQEENKTLKQEQRKLMTEVDQLMHQRAALAGENQQLSNRFKELQKEITDVRRQLEIRQSNIMKGPTHRSQHVPTIAGSVNSIPLQPLEEVDYEQQSEKLLQDYQKLLVENESMKRLQQEFYKQQPQSHTSLFKEHNLEIQSPQKPVSFHQRGEQDVIRSFSNHHIAQRLNSQRSSEDRNSQMFKTSQKQQLEEELIGVRGEAVEEVLKCYTKAVKQAEMEKKNALKIFMSDLSKNGNILGKMAENYLEMRATLKEEAGVELPKPIENLTGEAVQAFQMYKSVKQKAKNQGSSGMTVAIFRLLTLMTRCRNLPQSLLDNMQHTCLKYIYKMTNVPSNS